MLLNLALCAALSSPSTDAAPAVSDAPASPASSSSSSRLFVELPFALSAQGTASRVETVLTPWAGVRAGWLSSDGAGLFTGADAALLLGVEGGGTAEVALGKVPVLLEGRGLVGGRLRTGLFGAGVYGYGYVGGGGGLLTLSAFEDSMGRGFATWVARVGGGGELSFGLASLRLELGTGVRDARLDLHGAVAAGLRF